MLNRQTTKRNVFSIFVLCLFLCVGVICFALQTARRSERLGSMSIGYLTHFKKHKGFYLRQFRKKIASPIPNWVQAQIQRDLTVDRISLAAVEATQQAIRQHKMNFTNRYRIVDQKLYRYLDPETAAIQESLSEYQRAPIAWFEEALKTLLGLVTMPNVDFIINHEDGTFEPFYLVEDPHLQAPIFGWAKLKSTPFLVLIPDYRSLSSWWYNDVRKLREGKSFAGPRLPWDQKREAAFWRGALTEPVHRLKMAALSEVSPQEVNAGITSGDCPLSLQKPAAGYEEHLEYKYLPVLDGVMCTYPGYQWRLLSDAVCFKQESDQIQWFYGALEPYVHYVPIRNDLSDLLQQINWARTHDDSCRQIGERATEFALTHLMIDDIYTYLYHALMAYASLQDDSFEADWHALNNWMPLLSDG